MTMYMYIKLYTLNLYNLKNVIIWELRVHDQICKTILSGNDKYNMETLKQFHYCRAAFCHFVFRPSMVENFWPILPFIHDPGVLSNWFTWTPFPYSPSLPRRRSVAQTQAHSLLSGGDVILSMASTNTNGTFSPTVRWSRGPWFSDLLCILFYYLPRNSILFIQFHTFLKEECVSHLTILSKKPTYMFIGPGDC